MRRIIGDVHGLIRDYKFMLNGIESSIQLGDMGVGFGYDLKDASLRRFYKENPNHKFIRGNHDNPERVNSFSGFVKDGSVIDDVMYIGGAWSIDGPGCPWDAKRIPGRDWWFEEQNSLKDLELMLEVYKKKKPRVMITHDAPCVISREMFFKTGIIKGKEYHSNTTTMLQAMFEEHQPEEWYFGHWHISKSAIIEGTKFRCLDELEFVDVDW